VEKINELKREVFFRLLEMAERVYVLVRYSDSVMIGNRGFLKEERENGIVLVFNKSMKFVWDDSGIHATLVFGTAAEKCYIPPEDILSVYSPDLGVQLMVAPEESSEEPPKESKGEKERGGDEKIIKVDFRKKGL
jgi:hypothetical protein